MTPDQKDDEDAPITRAERLRRVVLLCSHVMRNLAIYRVGQQNPVGWKEPPFSAEFGFWREINSSSVDMCAIEWCKLFGDQKGKHFWKNVVTDQNAFENLLFKRLNTSQEEFAAYAISMRRYRDKFVAHLDSDRIMHVPNLDSAKSSIEFYHSYIVDNEAAIGDLVNLADTARKFSIGYDDCEREAQRVYRALQAN